MTDIQRAKSEIKSNLVWLVVYTILGSVCGILALLAALKMSALVALICAFGSTWSGLSARTCWEDVDSAIDDLEFLITYDMKLELKNE